jgi:hypothetical protein
MLRGRSDTSSLEGSISVKSSAASIGFVPIEQPSLRGKVIVGIDTWVWRELASGERRGNGIAVAARDVLQAAVDEGSALVPLSATTYLEMQGIKDVKIRDEVSRLAAELSKWHTFEAFTRVLGREIDTALSSIHASPVKSLVRGSTVGWGAHFMHEGQSKALRFLDRSGAVIDEPDLVLPGGRSLSELNDLAQMRIFCGPTANGEASLRANFGYAPEKTWAVAEDRLARYHVMVDILKKDADLRSRPADLIAAVELSIELRDILAERLLVAGVTPDTFLADKATVRTFLNALPTSMVRRSILRRILLDAGRAIKVNDINDLDLYATLVPQSHLVIAEKNVHHALTMNRLDEQLGVEIVKKLAEIPEALGRATTRIS